MLKGGTHGKTFHGGDNSTVDACAAAEKGMGENGDGAVGEHEIGGMSAEDMTDGVGNGLRGNRCCFQSGKQATETAESFGTLRGWLRRT